MHIYDLFIIQASYMKKYLGHYFPEMIKESRERRIEM